MITGNRAFYSAEKYTYTVMWSPDDNDYVGKCSEFPSLSHLAMSPQEALAGIIALVRDVLEDLRENKEQAPIPRVATLLFKERT